MEDDNHEEDEETNPYLALRKAKIARNQAKLKELGFGAKPPKGQRKPKKRPTPPVVPVVAKRRSRRISKFEQHERSKKKRKLSPLPSNFVYGQTKRKNGTSAPVEANSLITITLNSELLVTGGKKAWNNSVNNVKGDDDDDDSSTSSSSSQTSTVDSILGIQMEETGKECAVYESFNRAAAPADYERLYTFERLLFKTANVVEWKNAIFLFVDIGPPKTHPLERAVMSQFLKDGQQITWFGLDRMKEDSPIIQKLMKYGEADLATTAAAAAFARSTTSAATKDANNKDYQPAILLWCRRYDATRRSSQGIYAPYTCLGRLSYHSHKPYSRPIKFVWNLIDYVDLLQDKKARHQFQLILDTAAAAAAPPAASWSLEGVK